MTEEMRRELTDAGFDVDDPTDLAAVVQLLHCQIVHVPTTVLMDAEQTVIAVCAIDHILQILHGKRDRLFADDVFAGIQRRHNNFLVRIVGDGDRNHIDGRVAQKLLAGAVRTDAPATGKLTAFFFNVVDLIYPSSKW